MNSNVLSGSSELNSINSYHALLCIIRRILITCETVVCEIDGVAYYFDDALNVVIAGEDRVKCYLSDYDRKLVKSSQDVT